MTSSVWARSNQQTVNLELEDQDIILLNSTYKSEQRVMIISDEKCQKGDTCYRGNPVKGMIRIHHLNQNLSATYFYKIVNRNLEWNMVIFQEAQADGYVDVVIDRISAHHASAWSAFQPYKCETEGSYALPNINIERLENELNTSIHSISDLISSSISLDQFFTSFDKTVKIEDELQEELNVVSSFINEIATGVALYTHQENQNTVYEFMNDGNRIDNNLNMIVNKTAPKKFYNHIMNRVLREVHSASKVGVSLFSSAWFNLMKEQNTCYTLDDQIVNDMLD